MSIRIDVDAEDFDLGNETIEVECPECKTENTVTLGQVQRQERIKCSKCGITLSLKDEDGSTAKTIRNVNAAFGELQDTLRNLGG